MVIEAFARSHAGWRAPDLLLHDDRRSAFLAAYRSLEKPLAGRPRLGEVALGKKLLELHRANRLPRSPRRDPPVTGVRPNWIRVAAEISARRLFDSSQASMNDVLVDPEVRRRFDQIAQELYPGGDVYSLRRFAFRRRLNRTQELEVLKRVSDWQRRVTVLSNGQLRKLEQLMDREPSVIPARPGIFIFRGQSEYLFVGQTEDLQRRMQVEWEAADGRSLLTWLLSTEHGEQLQLELHVFVEGSPGEQLEVRQAYVNELIRVFRPRYNLVPAESK